MITILSIPRMETNLYKLSLMLLADVLPAKVDAIYLSAQPDGILKEHQIAQGVTLQERAPFIALCGGTGQGYRGFAEWAQALQESGISAERIIAVPYADTLNTHTEAVKLVAYAREHGWKQLVISSLPHHLTRVFLTTLYQIREQKSDLGLYAAPSQAIPWWKEVTHYQGEVKMIGHAFIDAEIERIARYQEKGDLCSAEEGLEYLQKRDQG